MFYKIQAVKNISNRVLQFKEVLLPLQPSLKKKISNSLCNTVLEGENHRGGK